MELKKKKFINNTRNSKKFGLPKYVGGNDLSGILGLNSNYIDNYVNNYIQDQYGVHVENPQPVIETTAAGNKVKQTPISSWTRTVNQGNPDPRQLQEPSYIKGVKDYTFNNNTVNNKNPQLKDSVNLGNTSQYMQLLGNAINSFTPGVDWEEMFESTGSSLRNRGGFSYNKLDHIDEKKYQKALDKKELSTVLQMFDQGFQLGQGAYDGGGLMKAKNGKLPKFMSGNGAALGAITGTASALVGLLGWSSAQQKLNDRINHANRLIDRTNGIEEDAATTKMIQQNNALNFGNPLQMPLRGYSEGLKPGLLNPNLTIDNYSEKSTRSPYGKVHKKQTGWGNGGEGLFQFSPDGKLISAAYLPKTGNGVDTYPISGIDQYTWIATKEEVDKMGGKKLFEKGGPLDKMGVLAKDELPKAKCGKLPKFGKGSAYAAAIPGVIGGLTKMFMANSPIKTSRSYARNYEADDAARILAGLRVSNYRNIPELYKLYNKTMGNLAMSGGLSGAQRALGKIKALSNLQDIYAKADIENQIKNNEYLSNYANFKANIGAQNTSNWMNAYNRDFDVNSRAEANRNGLWLSGLTDNIATTQQAIKNANDWEQFERMWRLYNADVETKQADTQAKIDYNNKMYQLYLNNPQLFSRGGAGV